MNLEAYFNNSEVLRVPLKKKNDFFLKILRNQQMGLVKEDRDEQWDSFKCSPFSRLKDFHHNHMHRF